MNQLEMTKELAELQGQQLQAIQDDVFLGWNENRDDVSFNRSLRISALCRELATKSG